MIVKTTGPVFGRFPPAARSWPELSGCRRTRRCGAEMVRARRRRDVALRHRLRGTVLKVRAAAAARAKRKLRKADKMSEHFCRRVIVISGVIKGKLSFAQHAFSCPHL
jgi:hypothetical protein